MSYFDSCEKCRKPFDTRSYCFAWCNECLEILPKCSKCNLPNDQSGDLCDLCYFKEQQIQKEMIKEKSNPYANKSSQQLEAIWQAQASIIQMSLMNAYNKDTNDLESDRLIALANQAQNTQSLVEKEKSRRRLK